LNFTISNPLSTPQTFLAWGTPTEGDWADMFDIRDEQNNRLTYIGKMVRRGEKPIDEEYVTVAAGEAISAVVNLGDNYEFLSFGKYMVRVDLPGYCELKYAIGEGQVAVFELESVPERKPIGAPQGFTNCQSTQISQINSAISGSITGSSRSYTCLNQGCDSQYARWFGTYSDTNWNFVSNAFRNINSRLSNSVFNGYCNPSGCGSNVFGYVYPTDTTYTVYLCNMFWQYPDERVNTIIHEMSHFRALAGTNDYAYGTSACLSLARSNPNQASHNADNVCYFDWDL
jgi:peptidyl-Lys metalloendopeptidase